MVMGDDYACGVCEQPGLGDLTEEDGRGVDTPHRDHPVRENTVPRIKKQGDHFLDWFIPNEMHKQGGRTFGIVDRYISNSVIWDPLLYILDLEFPHVAHG